MTRGRLSLALLASITFAGCAHTPPPQSQAFYHAPSNSYSLNLGSQARKPKLPKNLRSSISDVRVAMRVLSLIHISEPTRPY